MEGAATAEEAKTLVADGGAPCPKKDPRPRWATAEGERSAPPLGRCIWYVVLMLDAKDWFGGGSRKYGTSTSAIAIGGV